MQISMACYALFLGVIGLSVLLAIVLGIVQGITEFLPISSSGHLSILQNIFKVDYTEEEHLLFDVMLHLGTLIAVCIIYRKDIALMFKAGARLMQGNMNFSAFGDPLIPPARQLMFVVVATLPLVIVLFFSKAAASLFSMMGFIGFALAANGTLLYAVDKLIHSGKKNSRNMSFKDAIVIGLAQAVAVIPGISRSGVTISVGMSRGLSKSFAMRFSMLLSIPAVVGSLLVSLARAIGTGITWKYFPAYIVGMIFAAITGFLAINLLNRIIKRGRFGKLAYYCWGVGAIVMLLSFVI